MPRTRYTKAQIEFATQQIQESLRMLDRIKHGTLGADSQIDGDGPVNEYFAIGVVRSKLRFALQKFGIEPQRGPEL